MDIILIGAGIQEIFQFAYLKFAAKKIFCKKNISVDSFFITVDTAPEFRIIGTAPFSISIVNGIAGTYDAQVFT